MPISTSVPVSAAAAACAAAGAAGGVCIGGCAAGAHAEAIESASAARIFIVIIQKPWGLGSPDYPHDPGLLHGEVL